MPIKYPTEFKVKAIRRYEKGESIKELCKELNISQSTLTIGESSIAPFKQIPAPILQQNLMLFQGDFEK